VEVIMDWLTVLGAWTLSFGLRLALPVADGDRPATPPLSELRKAVQLREVECAAAQAALTEARARLAEAEGKKDEAAAQWRKLVPYHESRLQEVRALYARGNICTGEPYHTAAGQLAVARARAADAEGKPEALLAELPKVIAYYEWRLHFSRTLRENHAIPEDEARKEEAESAWQLRQARQRLDQLTNRPGAPSGGSSPKPE
jgi:hypothetical protein